MTFSSWMIIKSIVCAVFGVGFVAIPITLLKMFGLSTEAGIVLISRLFGAAFIFEAIIIWLLRNASRADSALRSLWLAIVVSNLLGLVFTAIATINGVWNFMGWLPVGLFLVFSLVFGYYLLTEPKS